jgi:hypothetical protein
MLILQRLAFLYLVFCILYKRHDIESQMRLNRKDTQFEKESIICHYVDAIIYIYKVIMKHHGHIYIV